MVLVLSNEAWATLLLVAAPILWYVYRRFVLGVGGTGDSSGGLMPSDIGKLELLSGTGLGRIVYLGETAAGDQALVLVTKSSLDPVSLTPVPPPKSPANPN
jgi:hypothetical protein